MLLMTIVIVIASNQLNYKPISNKQKLPTNYMELMQPYKNTIIYLLFIKPFGQSQNIKILTM
jgi:hypothetical protein